MFDGAVAVEGEVVGFLPNLIYWDEEMIGFEVAWFLWVAAAPLRHNIGKLTAFDALAFVVEGEAVVGEVVEPGVFRFAATGEDEDGGGDAGVGFEDAAGEADDGFEFGFLDEFFPCFDKGTAGAKEDSLRDDDAGGAASLEQGEDALGEEQLGLGGFEL